MSGLLAVKLQTQRKGSAQETTNHLTRVQGRVRHTRANS